MCSACRTFIFFYTFSSTGITHSTGIVVPIFSLKTSLDPSELVGTRQDPSELVGPLWISSGVDPLELVETPRNPSGLVAILSGLVGTRGYSSELFGARWSSSELIQAHRNSSKLARTRPHFTVLAVSLPHSSLMYRTRRLYKGLIVARQASSSI
ncbi:hypothetical protein PGTUg99_030318 [Puccinia graminis f. sp. tritici]|uniref:Uncharacterized protein n=1 Tax=Puccinia graminis f. sp. tritici TaxID=56615 RepID=A0A5B0LVU5_PUCGR|nr:hypothetical protein PGTUg99_030318 [Puccinia graminis f. sp. tritici]